MSPSTYRRTLLSVLAAGALARVAYVLVQPASDPEFSRPVLDGAYYLEWARGIRAGTGEPPGAYYLAPLYPWALAGFLCVFGERFAPLYLLQHAAVLGSAAFLASVARRAAGEAAGLAAAALVLLYHPALFFASRPMGEALGLVLLAASLWLADTYNSSPAKGRAWPLGLGFVSGLASLARPGLLLVAGVWALLGAFLKRRGAVALLAAGLALALGPVAIRNLAVSGHAVAISSNAGMTLYHGNGPEATGGYTLPSGFTGAISTQRREATDLARARSGRDLDSVEADGWWGREAIRVRAGDPIGTLRLFAWKALLLVDNAEQGLDYAPALDGNPLRRAAPVPFAALLGLAAAGLVALGARRSGGAALWTAVAACAAAPVAFYASSRYRMPVAVLLSVPAGCGLGALVGASAANSRRRVAAAAAAVALAALSLAVPSAELTRAATAGALANRAVSHKNAGDLAAAERDARRAVAMDPRSVRAEFNLGVVLEAGGRLREAEASYAEALAIDPRSAEAAGNLAGILIRRGGAREAIPLLERAIEAHPSHVVCRTNLVVARMAAGDLDGARAAASDAAGAGVAIDPELRRALGM